MTHIPSPPEGTTWHRLRTQAVVSLIVANLIPLYGALFLGWSVGSLVVLYWCETAVIGFYSILKLPFATRWHALISGAFLHGLLRGLSILHRVHGYRLLCRTR